MGDIRITRDFFLWCMAVVYLFAFTSLFVQIPGLYGDNGILPARLVIQKEAESFSDLFSNQPSLLRLLPRIGLDAQYGMDFLCLGGIILSFVAMVIRSQRNCVTFFFLWAFYLSLFQVGQTFLWFQWDILLLEVGFLTVVVAPFSILRWPGIKYHNHDSITMWLVKWLLFRLMFASGVVKLTSQCPTWWGLTAMNYHYETQCIPTPAAWWLHQLPEWFQKLSVVAVYIIEMPVPFLFFSPVRSQRLFAFYAQMLLQVMIILTGNYNFFNLLTVIMCISLVDDNFIRGCLGKPTFVDRDDPAKLPIIGPFWTIIRFVLNLVVYGGLVFWAVKLFSLRVTGNSIESNVTFSYKEFDKVLKISLPVTIYMGVASLAWEILKALLGSLVGQKGIIKKLFATSGVVVFGAAAMSLFAISLVDHTIVEENAYRKLWPVLHKWHDKTNHFTLTNSYGLFRRMTGVLGRPEVIIEGSNNMNSGWKEYEFLYKPGNVSHGLPIVAPHQPRLDWQMWFAALGSYQHNPWFLNLVYRLLNGEKAVLELMGKNPFPDKPPKYMRAQLYHYYFTHRDKQHERYSASDWWVRHQVQEYLPILTKEEPSFLNYLKQSGLMDKSEKEKNNPDPTYYIKYVMVTLRQILGQPEGFLSCMSIFVAGLVLTFLDPTVKLVEWPDS